MKNVSLTVRKRTDSGNWQAIIRQKQGNTWKQVESKGGFNKKILAQNWGNSKLKYWQSKTITEYDKYTIGKLKELYLQFKKNEIKETTLLTKISCLNSSKIIDDWYPCDLTKEKALELSNKISNAGMIELRTFYNFLIKELDMELKNPIKSTVKKQEEKRALITEEFLELRSFFTREDHLLALDMCYYHGLRGGELAGLTSFGDITDKYININKQWSGKIKQFDTPKSSNGYRKVPTRTSVYKEYLEYLSNMKTIPIDGRLFPFNNFHACLNYAMSKNLKNTPYKEIRLHHLRHSFITNLIQQGLDIQTVAYVAGDKVDTILKNYSHINKNTDKILRKAISEI